MAPNLVSLLLMRREVDECCNKASHWLHLASYAVHWLMTSPSSVAKRRREKIVSIFYEEERHACTAQPQDAMKRTSRPLQLCVDLGG